MLVYVCFKYFAGLVQAPAMMQSSRQLVYSWSTHNCVLYSSLSTRINNHVHVVVTILLPCILSSKIAVTYISACPTRIVIITLVREITEDKHVHNWKEWMFYKERQSCICVTGQSWKSECCWFQVHLNIVSRIRKFMVWKIRHLYIVAYGPYQP